MSKDKQAAAKTDPTRIVISVNAGIVQEVFCTDPNAEVTLIDWDTQECDDAGNDLADVGSFDVTPWQSIVGTDCGNALRRAGIEQSELG
jgi:hypothetical protein